MHSTAAFKCTYTANGERATATTGGATTTYSYDVQGNLAQVGLPTGTTITYLHDGLNRRISKKVNGTLVQAWLYGNALGPIAELNGSGQVVAQFIYATDGHVPSIMLRNGQTYRILTDDLGSPRLVINTGTGLVAQELSYDAWGMVQTDTNPGFQPFGFAGGLYDGTTDLTRFGRRDYDARVGRWTAKDPIRFAGGDPNLYRYVTNDPVNQIDPTGESGFRARAKKFAKSKTGRALSGGLIGAVMDGLPILMLEWALHGWDCINWNNVLTSAAGGAFLGALGGWLRGAREARNMATALRTASKPYKGTSAVGHAFQKHAGRNPHIWGQAAGGPAALHQQGLRHFDEIMQAPGQFIRVTNSRGITFLEKWLPDGRGMRLQLDYIFKGFLDL